MRTKCQSYNSLLSGYNIAGVWRKAVPCTGLGILLPNKYITNGMVWCKGVSGQYLYGSLLHPRCDLLVNCLHMKNVRYGCRAQSTVEISLQKL
jgi:hypothetical protein